MKSKILAAATLSLCALETQAATQFHRLVWDADPAHQAVVAFSAKGISTNPYVTFGFDTNEDSWQTQTTSSSENFVTFLGYIKSYFVRLNDLPANSDIFYRVCDQDGCGDRFYFKTAPVDNSPYVAIAGGDTRTGWTNRRKGNALVGKIRPLFVMHGGDYTNLNSSAEVSSFFSDWELSYSNDVINGVEYKRTYPIIPTHGNHEDGNFKTLCKIFGVDYNADGKCDEYDTYGAFNISPLLRTYTLNSQFQNSGWSSQAATMNSWLTSDLANQGTSATWRIAQYHKPMFPHYSGKSANTELFDWWSQAFYEHGMNLVVESDTHINKMTQALVPNGDDFTASTSGTVFVGEGSWGAPARSANDPKTWSIDLASIQQFKVLQVTLDTLVVRTAQFDETAETLTKAQRDADTTLLPNGVNWWHANNVGDALNLVQDANRLSVIENLSSGGTSQISIAATHDTYIASNKSNSNFNGSANGLLADGYDISNGKMFSLIAFDIENMSDCADTSRVQLEIDVTDASIGNYEIYAANTSWQESNATWNGVGGESIKGALLTTFKPTETGMLTVDLSNSNIVDYWRANGNTGLVIAHADNCNGLSCNGVDFHSKETGSGPVLKVNYDHSQHCIPEGSVEAASGAITQSIFTEGDGESQVFRFTLNSGFTDAELHGLSLRADGDIHEVNDISGVTLYRDSNGNGSAEANEQIALSNYTVDNGTISFTFATALSLPQGSNAFLVTYQL